MTTVKIILVGETCVGKTALLRRFVEHSFAPDGLKSTIGVDFKSKKVKVPGHSDADEVSLQIWDTAGQERFRSISNTYYRGCEGAMVIYDVSSRASFERLSYWIDDLLRGTGREHLEGFSVFIVGNKADLPVSARQVSTQEAKQWCQSKGLSHLEVSAKDGLNVDQVFLSIAASALDYRENMSEDMRALLDTQKCITTNGGGGDGKGGMSGLGGSNSKKGNGAANSKPRGKSCCN